MLPRLNNKQKDAALNSKDEISDASSDESSEEDSLKTKKQGKKRSYSSYADQSSSNSSIHGPIQSIRKINHPDIKLAWIEKTPVEATHRRANTFLRLGIRATNSSLFLSQIPGSRCLLIKDTQNPYRANCEAYRNRLNQDIYFVLSKLAHCYTKGCTTSLLNAIPFASTKEKKIIIATFNQAHHANVKLSEVQPLNAAHPDHTAFLSSVVLPSSFEDRQSIRLSPQFASLRLLPNHPIGFAFILPNNHVAMTTLSNLNKRVFKDGAMRLFRNDGRCRCLFVTPGEDNFMTFPTTHDFLMKIALYSHCSAPVTKIYQIIPIATDEEMAVITAEYNRYRILKEKNARQSSHALIFNEMRAADTPPQMNMISTSPAALQLIEAEVKSTASSVCPSFTDDLHTIRLSPIFSSLRLLLRHPIGLAFILPDNDHAINVCCNLNSRLFHDDGTMRLLRKNGRCVFVQSGADESMTAETMRDFLLKIASYSDCKAPINQISQIIPIATAEEMAVITTEYNTPSRSTAKNERQGSHALICSELQAAHTQQTTISSASSTLPVIGNAITTPLSATMLSEDEIEMPPFNNAVQEPTPSTTTSLVESEAETVPLDSEDDFMANTTRLLNAQAILNEKKYLPLPDADAIDDIHSIMQIYHQTPARIDRTDYHSDLSNSLTTRSRAFSPSFLQRNNDDDNDYEHDDDNLETLAPQSPVAGFKI